MSHWVSRTLFRSVPSTPPRQARTETRYFELFYLSPVLCLLSFSPNFKRKKKKENGLTVSPQNKYVVELRLSGLRPCPTFSPLTCVTFGRARNGPRLLEIQEMDGKVNVYLCMSAYVWGRERNGGRRGGCWKKVLVILEMKRAENTDWVMTGSVS